MRNEGRLALYQDLLLPKQFPSRETIGMILTPVLIALVLLLLDRYGIQRGFYQHFQGSDFYQILGPERHAFAAQLHFSLSCLLLFVVIPIGFHLAFPLGGMYRYGLSLDSAVTHFPIYLTLLGVMLPVLWWVSADPSFNQFYPFYKPEGLGDWLLFELIYMLQFFALEFFFRGFCLFRLERIMGLYAVAVMTIPYALIHIYKPLPEALGSIVAGLVLGYLAIKTRSIWPGLLVHCGVAIAMDTFSLIRNNWFAGL